MRGYDSVFNQQVLTIQRKGASYLNENEDLVIPDDVTFDIKCDIQPIATRMTKQVEAPNGYTLSSAKYVSTMHILNTLDDEAAIAADETIINGRKYYVWTADNWNNGPLSTDRYNDYILVMKRLPNEGSV
jgi:hypothetical protein